MRVCALAAALLLCGWAPAGAGGRCRGLSGAVVADDLPRLRAILAGGCEPAHASDGVDPLRLAVAAARVEAARLLLEAGADPNAVDRHGAAVVHWLGSRPRVKDDDVLAVATLLDRHRCAFKDGGAPGSANVIVNLAPRRLPKTLAFLASKGIASDYSPALRAIARSDDVESIGVLLKAGADPLAGAARGSALADAALAGRTTSAALMLKYVKDMSDAKVLAAYEGALRTGHAETAQAFVDAGVAQAPVPAPPPCAPSALTSEQSRLLARLGLPNASRLSGLAGDMNCKLIQRCGGLLLVDCNSAADGPAYYIDQRAPKVLAVCGGACMSGCSNCPPKEWTCNCNR